ncbi:MAG TPA: outer membrane protein assembly factor BamA [Candidatus Saccharimonadaceae bacterium]|nr:outer membrane protein assembly factor BamA [Candidatus Saccharimonadaceae bacterium]
MLPRAIELTLALLLGAAAPALSQTPATGSTPGAGAGFAADTTTRRAPADSTMRRPPASAFAADTTARGGRGGFGADSLAAPLPGGPAAGETATPEMRVGRIEVVGNVVADSARVVRTFEVAPGSRFSDDEVRRGLRKLYALGVFSDAYVTQGRPHDGIVDLVIHVKERARFSKIEFTGNHKKTTADLEKKLLLHSGEPYSPTAVQTQIDSLLLMYHDDGFAQATIQAVTDSVTADNQVGLRFVIHEGEKVKITRIQFAGVRAFPEKKLRKQMKTKTKGFFGGGDVKDENFDEDRDKIEAWYHNRGYHDAKVLGHDLKPGDTSRHLTYVVQVDEGPRYRTGAIHWAGASVIPDAELAKLWKGKPHDWFDHSKAEKAQQDAYAAYAEKGYLYLNVEPVEEARDSVVDVTFQVTEGQPSNIRYVNVVGNKGTREKVIRREISVHEGDRFRRSALMRTQQDVFRLGIFEDVNMDFTPADSSDVDINIKLKEKQVGTASAGAGYTNEGGLTGFLELGHNNVLGNAQSVQLHLERGGKREDYLLSFTEPWFRDTPTLLGFSGFNSTRDLDLYTEKRVGGSARIGRPFAWPDHSRGSLEYQLEDVTISSLNATLSAVDSITLAGIQPGHRVLTSSVETNFLRVTTDSPFYPTKGTKFTVDDELAGGPFGGSVNFHKHRIEGRVYLPSVLHGFTTMLRARVGLMGEYGDQNIESPRYERFRLGGGTTVDPVRGYDDYQIVPDKFIQDVYVRTDSIVDASGNKVGIPRFQRVRYPGGRYMTIYTAEQQFPIVNPLHGVLFFDAGNTWDLGREYRPLDLKMGAGVGIRLEIPLLGNIGFDYGYGFNRDDGPRAVGHFLIGNVNN